MPSIAQVAVAAAVYAIDKPYSYATDLPWRRASG